MGDRISLCAPIKFHVGQGMIASHAVCELKHVEEQLAKLGKLRDKATGERRDALNDAIRLMTAPRRKTAYAVGKEAQRPVAEPRQQ